MSMGGTNLGNMGMPTQNAQGGWTIGPPQPMNFKPLGRPQPVPPVTQVSPFPQGFGPASQQQQFPSFAPGLPPVPGVGDSGGYSGGFGGYGPGLGYGPGIGYGDTY